MTPNVTQGEGVGGSKKCLKSVTYYLNGHLAAANTNHDQNCFLLTVDKEMT